MHGPRDNADLAAHVRTIPDYPRTGILFRDVSTLFLDGPAFHATIERLADQVSGRGARLVAGIEARGFIVAAALAFRLGIGTVLMRKRDKLPGERIGRDYVLEYGTDRIEMHADACGPGGRVLLVDDLIATGGTATAGVELLRSTGAEVVGAAFVIDLPELGGADKIRALGVPVDALITFPGH